MQTGLGAVCHGFAKLRKGQGSRKFARRSREKARREWVPMVKGECGRTVGAAPVVVFPGGVPSIDAFRNERFQDVVILQSHEGHAAG